MSRLKETRPFEYLTFGNQMRRKMLQANKQKEEIECEPMYDSTTFK
jgi:hypothetical protein